MKLNQLSDTSAKKLNKFVESRFGFSIDFDKLSVVKAEQLKHTISENLNRIRHSVDFHTAERNPRYMELVAVHESLEQWLTENRTTLTESDVGNAEVLLAAKDMVDSVQDMIEKVGKMQYEQMPQLIDSIQTVVGETQADNFKSSASSSLESLMSQLSSAREELNSAVRVLSGQESAPMAVDQEIDSDFDIDDTDGFSATTPAIGGRSELGRERR